MKIFNKEISRDTLFKLLSIVILALVALTFFFPDAIEGRTLQQSDMQQGIANGEEGRAFKEATGETTRWTDSLLGGMPNFQISPSYPANSMLDWVVKVYTLGFPSPSNLLFAMMLGFFLMCLCFRMRWYTSLFASIAWGLSSYFIIIIGAGHIWKFLTLAFIPPTIGGVALCYRGKYLGGMAMTALFGAIQLQSNHPQMSYYFMFVMMAMVVAWLIMAIKEKKMRRWGIATACALFAGCLALAANSASLYNSYEYSKETVRGKASDIVVPGENEGSGGGYDYVTSWSYGADETFTLLVPNVKGGASIKPVEGQNTLKSVLDGPHSQKFALDEEEAYIASQFPQYFGNQPMTNGPVYVGAFVLVLAILALFVVEGPMIWALFAVTLLSIFLAWGANFPALSHFFVDYVPGFNKFRTISSILVIAEFTLPLMAAMCIRKMVQTPDYWQKYITRTLCVCGFFATVCLLIWMWPSIFGAPFSENEKEVLAPVWNDPAYSNLIGYLRESRLKLVSGDALRSLLFIMAGTLILWLWLDKKLMKAPYMVSLLAVVVLIDLFNVNKRYVSSENFVAPQSYDDTFNKTAADEAILQDKSNYRVMPVGALGDARTSYFHKSIGGYHAAKLTRYEDLLKYRIQPEEQNMIENIKHGTFTDSLLSSYKTINMLNGKYYIVGDEYFENPYALGNAWFVENLKYADNANKEMEMLAAIDPATMAVADKKFESTLGNAMPKTPGDTIYEQSYAPNKLTYRYKSAKGGLAVFSEIYFPWGWKATVDGKEVPIGRVNYVLRAMQLPAGEHEIVMTFDPQSLKVTNNISVASVILIWLLVLGAVGYGVFKCVKKKDDENTVVEENAENTVIEENAEK